MMLRIFLVAGEASGDTLGAGLMAALNKQAIETIEWHGIGGPKMEDAGLKSLFPLSDLSVMGLAEVLPRFFLLRRRLKETLAAIQACQPDILITIDSPGFCKRLVSTLRKQPAEMQPKKIIHYVAPTVWAWRPQRASEFARLYDCLLALLPFEPPYFTKTGLKTVFVGHPLSQPPSLFRAGEPQLDQFQQKYELSDHRGPVILLPGSRAGEVKRHLPVFLAAFDLYCARYQEEKDATAPQVFILTLPHLASLVKELVGNRAIPVVSDPGDHPLVRQKAQSALAASGTISLELAQSGIPHVIAYRVNPLTWWILRQLVKIPSVNLINILCNETMVPEYLQAACRPAQLAEALFQIDQNPAIRARQTAGFRRALTALKPETEGLSASEMAARTIRELL